MEKEKIIFFSNFLFRAFIIGILFAVFFFALTVIFRDSWVPFTERVLQVEEKDLGIIVSYFFVTIRIVLIFFFLVPSIALHWMAKSK